MRDTSSIVNWGDKEFSRFHVIGFKRQYSLKVIFISFSVKLQFFAAVGKFHLAANNISIDCRVSGLILITLENLVVIGVRVNNHKKVKGVKNTPDFLLDLFGIKSRNNIRGSPRNDWFRVEHDTILADRTDNL